MFGRSICKKIISVCLSAFLLTGCGSTESVSMSQASILQDKKAVASWEDSAMVLQERCMLTGDTLYYVVAKWDNEAGRQTNVSICRKLRGTVETEEAVVLEEEAWLLTYFLDECESVYCFYGREENGETAYSLKKVSRDGETVFDKIISGETKCFDSEYLETVFAGAADREGRICLANAGGDLYLFNAAGEFVCLGKASWDAESYNGGQCGLVVGAADIFIYLTEGREVRLQGIDMDEGTLGTAAALRPDGREKLHGISLEVHSGHDRGIFLSDSDALWRYDPLAGALTEILRWRDSAVNMGDYRVGAIGILPGDALYVLAHQSYSDTAFVQIDFREEGEEAEKQIVTLAAIEGFANYGHQIALEEMAGAFNRVSEEYQVEFAVYGSVMDLDMALVRGEGPDIFPVCEVEDILVLADKGVLEGLSPYFAESSIVREEDLLVSVRNAGMINGELVCVFPTFGIYGIKVKKGTTNRGVWMPEDYIALGEENPELPMFHDFHPSFQADSEYYNHILWVSIKADMGSYIDKETGECHFDDEKFIALLDRIKGLKVPASAPGGEISRNGSKEDLSAALRSIPELFEEGELLTFENFTETLTNTEGEADYGEVAGYPSRSGRPCYRLDDCGTALSMNSASENKEGAWAFLEYLLSEEYQSGMGTFPVRQDAFDRFLDFSGMLPGGYRVAELTEESKEELRYRADNMYWLDAVIKEDYIAVILEETGAVWSGDRTARDAAENIQNRISLSLSE